MSRARRTRVMRFRGLMNATVSAALVLAGVSVSASAASAVPDPDLYPNVVDVPAVSATFTAPGTLGGSYMALPVGTVPAGTAKILHGVVVNGSSAPLCVFSSARGSGFLVPTSTATGVNLRILESTDFPSPLADRLPTTAGASQVRAYPIVTTGSEWTCDFGTLLDPGASLDYTVTVGVPLGGTPITTATFALRAYLEAAQSPPSSWNDDDFLASALANNSATPFTINASSPSSNWGFDQGIGAGTAWPGRALGAYGVFANDLTVPVTVTYAGFSGDGVLARFVESGLQDWTDSITLQPGETTDTFLMMFGSPESIGNESQGTQMTFAFNWQVIAPRMVTFDANGGTGTMANQIADSPTALTANIFTREGYTFTGWNTESDGSGTGIADGATHTFDADITLYAQWKPITPAALHTVTFMANGGSGTMANQTADSPTVLTTNLFVREGYTFTGWNTESDGSGTGIADGATYAFNADMTVYAQWQPNTSPPISTPAPTPNSVHKEASSLPVTGGHDLASVVTWGLVCLMVGSGAVYLARLRNPRS